MSREEDLLLEATGLNPRIELQCGDDEPIVVGFRRDGSGSVYFGQQFVVQFNARGELRRGFRNGRLLKAERNQLVELTRDREAEVVYLVRHELDPAEQQRYLDQVWERLQRLAALLRTGEHRVRGSVPADAPVEQQVAQWLEKILAQPLKIASRPGVR